MLLGLGHVLSWNSNHQDLAGVLLHLVTQHVALGRRSLAQDLDGFERGRASSSARRRRRRSAWELHHGRRWRSFFSTRGRARAPPRPQGSHQQARSKEDLQSPEAGLPGGLACMVRRAWPSRSMFFEQMGRAVSLHRLAQLLPQSGLIR